MNKRPNLSAEPLLADIDLDYRRQRLAESSQYTIPYDLLSRLLHVLLPIVPETNDGFITASLRAAQALPDSVAKAVLQKILDPEMDRSQVGGLYRLFWSTRWQEVGCPAVTMDAPLAAALMLTETDPELLDEIKPPWPCFIVRLPLDLVSDGDVPYTHVVIHHFTRSGIPADMVMSVPEEHRSVAERIQSHTMLAAGPTWGIYGMCDGRGQLQQEATLSELLGKEVRTHLIEPEVPDTDIRHRIMEVLTRLAIGVCQMISGGASLRKKSTKKGRQPWRFGKLPACTEYVLSSDVRVTFDGTESVRLYTRGEARSLPKYQWVVRGHWRNQACGPGLTERRLAWIQPYWKGPADAPRLFRDHRIDPGRENGDE